MSECSNQSLLNRFLTGDSEVYPKNTDPQTVKSTLKILTPKLLQPERDPKSYMPALHQRWNVVYEFPIVGNSC